MSVPLAYRDVDQVQVLCLLQSSQGVASPADTDRLCDAVARIAQAGSPLPVSRIALGDPQVIAPSRLTLLVHGSLSNGGNGRRLALAVRPYRASTEQSDVLFGAMPRTADFDDDAQLQSAIDASLDELLPWRSNGTGVRPIDRP